MAEMCQAHCAGHATLFTKEQEQEEHECFDKRLGHVDEHVCLCGYMWTTDAPSQDGGRGGTGIAQLLGERIDLLRQKMARDEMRLANWLAKYAELTGTDRDGPGAG